MRYFLSPRIFPQSGLYFNFLYQTLTLLPARTKEENLYICPAPRDQADSERAWVLQALP